MAQRDASDDRKLSTPSVSSANDLVSEECSYNGGLSTREEMGYNDVASKSQTKRRRGACTWQRLCSDRSLIVAVFIIVILWVLVVGFIALFIVGPGEVTNCNCND